MACSTFSSNGTQWSLRGLLEDSPVSLLTQFSSPGKRDREQMNACSTVTLPGLEEPVSGSSGRRHCSLTDSGAKPLNYIRQLSKDLLYCTLFILDRILLCSSSIDSSEGQNLPALPPSMVAGLQELQRWKLCCLLCFVLRSNKISFCCYHKLA